MDSILSRQRQDDCSDGNSSPNRSTTASPSRPFTHANLDGALGDEPLSPPTTPQPMSKRHQKVSATFTLLTQQFSLSREPTFLAMLNQIQSRLEELHDGKDEEYRQQIAILEDERDRQLLAVEAARGFALERIEREYEEEKRLAEKEYQTGKKKGKDELLQTLTKRLERLRDDHILLNQAHDAVTLNNHACAPHAPLTIPTNPLALSSRNLRTPGSKRSVRNRDEDTGDFGSRGQSQTRPVKRGRKEDVEIYGEAGMWERDKATKALGGSDDLGTADLASIRKAMGVTRTGKGGPNKGRR